MRAPLRTCTCVREGVKAEIAGCVVFVILFWQIPEVCQTRHLSQHVAPQTPARTLGCQCKLRPLPSPQLRPYSNLLWRVKHPSKTPVPICVPDVFPYLLYLKLTASTSQWLALTGKPVGRIQIIQCTAERRTPCRGKPKTSAVNIQKPTPIRSRTASPLAVTPKCMPQATGRGTRVVCLA